MSTAKFSRNLELHNQKTVVLLTPKNEARVPPIFECFVSTN